MFRMAKDAIAPEKIPKLTLYTGAFIPGIGMGTFGSDHASAACIADAVREALQIGYRFIDCAACYGNEAEIGAVFSEALSRGLPRDELFVVSKVWNDSHEPEALVEACKKSLSDLQLDYLDLYLVHWPFPNYHAPGCDADARNPDSKPYIHEDFMKTWRAMESLVQDGWVRHIGTSNVTIPKLQRILNDAEIKPAVNEMELHPCFQQEDLFRFCVDQDILPIGYSPIGSPARPERDRASDDVVDTEHAIIKEIAAAHGVHPAEICLKWASQRGQIPIPFSTKRAHLHSNLHSVTENPLSREEMEKIKTVECGCRLIKGQVFLWESAKSWEDLWDIDGTICGSCGSHL